MNTTITRSLSLYDSPEKYTNEKIKCEKPFMGYKFRTTKESFGDDFRKQFTEPYKKKMYHNFRPRDKHKEIHSTRMRFEG